MSYAHLRQSFSCPITGSKYWYANDDELVNAKRLCALDAAVYAQRISDEKVKMYTATLATAVTLAEGFMKENTDAFAQTDRILAEAIAHHTKMTAYFKVEKEKYERDAAEEQEYLKRILVAAEQEKAAADTEIVACRTAIAAHNTEKEERTAALVREQREREAAAAEAAARRSRELREHEAAARAQFIPAERAKCAPVSAHGARCGLQEGPARVTAYCAMRPATRSVMRPIISEQTKQALLIRQGGLCGNASTGHGCGQQLPISRADGEPRPIFDIDHILPISDMSWRRYGGDPNNIDNLQALCPNCHAIKTRHTDRGRVIG